MSSTHDDPPNGKSPGDNPSRESPTNANRNECDGCSASCETWRVLVSAEDAQREPRITREARELPENQRTPLWRFVLFPLPFHESCCFLDEKNRCGIYETRPRVCREFEAGSVRCQEARALGNLPRLLPMTVEGREAAESSEK
ncbi:MAG: YkgJ family cysteine cluster protein [Planctomycetota bacterium]|nr:YkgJ family cysteine cluster protein [Planctomycetota bacterium]